jgi:glycosyltransferase involved in cell wall biosynthesis
MNLLFFIHSLQSGGAERVTANLANYWAAKGWCVAVVTLTSSASDFYTLHPDVQRIGLDAAGSSDNLVASITSNLHRVAALRRVLKDTQPDVALSMMSTANILLALASLGLKELVCVGSERTYPPMMPLGRIWRALRARLYGQLDAVVALTIESERWLQKHTNTRCIPVIPNAATWPLPLQMPVLPPPKRVVGKRILLAVGRLGKEKGFHHLIQVFQQLEKAYPNWQLFIIGEGPQRKALEAQVLSASLEDRVFLPGRAGNLGQWYETADLYVMSSSFEGFPNTLVEAMAHGLPAVSFDCETGPRDIIRNEVDGLLVPAGDLTAMVGALRQLMSDTTLRARMGSRAEEVRERYSLERVTSMWEQLFKDVR